MKNSELKIKRSVCVLAQQHVWDGARCAVLPRVRLGWSRTSVCVLPTFAAAFPTLSEAGTAVLMSAPIRKRRRHCDSG